MDEIYEGAEVQEVADPAETSEEMQEVAEPAEPEEPETEVIEDGESGKTEQDAAFAELRRSKEEAEQRNAELEAELAQMNSRRKLMENAFGVDEPEIEAVAERLGIDPEDILAELQHEDELERIKKENETLSSQLEEQRISERMRTDLAEIQKIDPTIKSLEQLGDDFINFIRGGLDGVDAYFAAKAKEERTRAKPPAEIGKVNNSKAPKDFFSEAEVDAMSPEEVRQNLDAIHRSMKKWK